MARRTKSINELFAQYKRISNANKNVGTAKSRARTARATKAYATYVGNIKNATKTKPIATAMDEAYKNGDMRTYNSLASKANNERYSRRTYMGLSQG